MIKMGGIIAAGHELTAEAAEEMLRAGGNAFDAIVAAHFAACVAEPVLASLGGGGFALAMKNAGRALVYDFFVQTPKSKRSPKELDFRPVVADFGTAQQEFHIGQGTIATPGSVRGLFAVHKDLCTMPLRDLLAPAIQYAREGIALNELQAYIFGVVRPIYLATPAARRIFGTKQGPNQLIGSGEILTQEELADTLESLAIEGEDLFYRGEIAAGIVRGCQQGGGHLTRSDLESYHVVRRRPLEISHGRWHIFTNPPPSSGGILTAIALGLLGDAMPGDWAFGSYQHLKLLAETMELTNQARLAAPDRLQDENALDLLRTNFLEQYKALLSKHAQSLRGTTHISIMDAQGNIAAMTVSNGEGCGDIVPGTGIMLNNMLGEEDLNPAGFHAWQTDRRMSSMMAPTLLTNIDGERVVTGSGGSNRIRTALLQVLLNLMDFGMDVESAVTSPRIHYEEGKLHIETGFSENVVSKLLTDYPAHQLWHSLNLFFGGAHTVTGNARGFAGAGDPRRGGVCRLV